MVNFEPIPINPNVTVRKTDWIQVCPYCQNERILKYPQVWNIKKGKCLKECKGCAIELGLISINKKGLEKGRKWNGGTSNKKLKNKSIQCEYQHLFNSLSKRDDIRLKFRKAKLGKFGQLANNWQGGKKELNQLLRNRDEYKKWRSSVFIRDNYTCQICNIKNVYLEADHIKEWCNYPELRYELTNGRTLCKPCHKKTDNYGGKAMKGKKYG